jgi:hypothetical protein
MGRLRQKNTGNQWNLEAVFRAEKSPDFSATSDPIPAGYGGNSRNFPVGFGGIRLFPESRIIDLGKDSMNISE